jgi:hypothetical protein
MRRTPRRYDAEQVRHLSDTTIAYYSAFVAAREIKQLPPT